METNLGENAREKSPANSEVGRSISPFSPRASRPKLPVFSGISYRRARTAPIPSRSHDSEFKDLIKDIAKLKKVDFIKTYSRSRTPASRPTDLKTMSTTTSPIGSPTLISPTAETGKLGPSGGRRLNRSLSLKLLTERLKSGRYSSEASQSKNNIPDSGSRDYGHTPTFGSLRRIFPQRAKNMSESVSDTQRSSLEPKPGSSIDSKLTSDYPGDSSSDIYAREIKSDEGEASGKNGKDTDNTCSSVTDISKHSEAASSEADTSRTFVSSCVLGVPRTQTELEPSPDTSEIEARPELAKDLDVSEDEGVDSSDPSPSKSTDSRSRSPSTGRPHRRSGAAAVAMTSEVQKAFGSQACYEDTIEEGAKGEEPGTRRFVRRSDNGVNGNGQKTSSLRFITHPPQRKSNLTEGGSVDSNGLGSLKSHNGDESPAGPGELTPRQSDMSLADSFGDSDTEPLYSDVVESVLSEGSDPDKFEKRNGKSLKQKSKSDPSGDKTREALELPMGEIPMHAPSTPALTEDKEEMGVLPEFRVTEEDKKAKSKSEDILSQVADLSTQQDEGTDFKTPPETPEIGRKEFFSVSPGSGDTPSPREHHTRYAGFAHNLSPSWTDSERPVRRYAGLSASSSAKPASPTPHERSHPYTLLLSVPPPRKPILRSASSASVLQRDRERRGYYYSLAPSSKEKDPVRKYSATTDEAPSAQALKAGTSVPEFASAIGDSMAALATSMPDVWQPCSASASPERELEGSGERIKDKRYHIVEELYRNEKEYVDALKTLKDKYMSPLKSQSVLDDTVVDNIFYMVPEILIHHSIYLDFLDNVWKNWDTQYSTVGNIVINIFSKQTVLDSYLSFVENYKTSGRVIESALVTKSSVSKFLEHCHRDSGSKLTIKDLIVRPIQRIPRYELLLQRLIENTPKDHPDAPLLQQAEKVMHDLAVKIGTATETKQEEDMQETLKKLELLLVTELNAPDRMYLKHDMVQISNKKDQCCMWLFSDLIIFSSVKRKSGPVARKVSLILKSPSGQDYAENIKHKTWLRVGLDDIEVLKSVGGSLSRRSTFDKEQVEEDLNLLNQVNEICLQLQCNHQILEEAVKELVSSLNRQLTDYNVRSPSAESNKLELLVTTQEGLLQLLVIFSSAEKRSSWESAFLDAKQKLSLLSDKRAPEFLQPLQITKTRAGMQFSCAAPIDGVNANGYRDVWVCNSDGYVGHMCLLSLQPEPIVTLNTPVPGCNARILCICAVPSFSGPFKRKGSNKSFRQRASPGRSSPHVTIESPESMDNGNDEDGYQSDSESSDDEPIAFRASQGEELFPKGNYEGLTVPSSPTSHTTQPITTSGSWTQDPHKSTMWLGTEDGCIHIFQCTDNIKTTKNKLKIQHGAAVYCIVYLDNKVFLSLANGNLIVYKRDQDGQWVCDQPLVRSLGSANAPITKMLAVAGKLWCGCQNNISVINPATLNVERSFTVSPDSNRSVQCLVTSGQGVWIASQQSAKVLLYHATSYEYLLEVSIAQAVSQKLQSADDIIRQHKAACLRITSLLICKDLLWVGTSAGVILTIPIPKITSTTTRGSLNIPTVTGLVYGHTGHVRFLTSIELPSSIVQKLEISSDDQANENLSLSDIQRRASMAAPATMATRMLVISGGDGYEDFRNNVSNEAAGRDDSTNHLLLWQV